MSHASGAVNVDDLAAVLDVVGYGHGDLKVHSLPIILQAHYRSVDSRGGGELGADLCDQGEIEGVVASGAAVLDFDLHGGCHVRGGSGKVLRRENEYGSVVDLDVVT